MSQRYIVRIKVDDVIRSELWTSNKPISLGYGLPFRLTQRPEGLFIEHKDGKLWKVQEDHVETKTPFLLPRHQGVLKSDVFLRVERAPLIPGFYDDLLTPQKSSPLDLIDTSGAWVHSTRRLGKHYTQVLGGEKIFSVSQSDSGWKIHTHAPSVTLAGATNNGEVLNSEIHLVTIQYRSHRWIFRVGSSDQKALPWKSSAEEGEKKRIVISGMLSTLAISFSLTVLSLLGTMTEPKLEEPVQFAKIILPERMPPKDLIKEMPDLPEPPKVIEAKKPVPLTQTEHHFAEGGIKKGESPTPIPVKPTQKMAAPEVAKVTPPNPKVVSQAVLKAQQLRNSLVNKMGGEKSLLLAESNTISGVQNEAMSGQLPDLKERSRLSAAPITQAHSQQNVSVDYSESSQTNVGGVNYRTGFQGQASVGAGSSFVALGAGLDKGELMGSGLTKKEVWSVISRHITEVRKCYEDAILRMPSIEGQLMVDFTIASNGRVSSANVKETTMKDVGVGKCITDRLSQWEFPQPKGSRQVSVLYPFVFRRL